MYNIRVFVQTSRYSEIAIIWTIFFYEWNFMNEIILKKKNGLQRLCFWQIYVDYLVTFEYYLKF